MTTRTHTRPRTLTKTAACREYGLSRAELEALIAAGVVWTVSVPGRERRPKVDRRGLDAWLDSGRPAAEPLRRPAAMPREV